MQNETSLAPAENGRQSLAVSIGFDNADTFALLQRAAALLSNSTLVPAQYRAVKETKQYGKVVGSEPNPNAVSNCVIALNIARRMHADELMVMQNLYVVEGRPAWSAQWVIAAVNTCGKFSPLRFEITDLGSKEVEYSVTEWEDGKKQVRKVKQTIGNLQCIAWVTEKGTNERLEGPPVTMEMAVQEGWYGKAGSKWQTMPQVMLRYRAASFFGKLYAPELLMGLPTAEEIRDEPIVERHVEGREIPAATVPQLFSGVPAAAAPSANTGAGESQPASAGQAEAPAASREATTRPRPKSEPAILPLDEPAAELPHPDRNATAVDDPADNSPPEPKDEFWQKCVDAKMDDVTVMGLLKKHGLAKGEWPADLTNEEAASIAPLWPKLVASYDRQAAAEGGAA